MKTISPTFSLRSIMLLYLLLLMAVPHFAFASDGLTYKGMWPKLAQEWYFNQPRGVSVDKNNNVYVADTFNHRIQKFSSSGVLQLKIGSKGTGEGQFDSPTGVAVASDGSIYVADTGNSRVQKFSSTGVFKATWGDNQYGNKDLGQFNMPHSIAIDSAGNIYVADTANSRVQKFDSSFTPLYALEGDKTGTNQGNISSAMGVAVDSQDNVYVCDDDTKRIWKFNSSGNFIAQWGVSASPDGFFKPFGISVDSSNNVYVADTPNFRVLKFSSDGIFKNQWGAEGPGPDQFGQPSGVAVDSSGNMYVTDGTVELAGNSTVHKLSPTGAFAASWRFQGSDEGYFYYPRSIAVNSDGTVYVADTGNLRLMLYSATGSYLSTDSQPIEASNGVAVDSSGGVNIINSYSDSAYDSAGNSYVADPWNNVVNKIGGGSGSSWQGGDGSGCDMDIFCTPPGNFSFPTGVAVDPSDTYVYVVDNGKNRIQKFKSDGTFLTMWGEKGSGNGQFDNPNKIKVDKLGNVHVTDTGNNRLQKFNADGVFLSSTGTAGSGNGEFYGPYGIAINKAGDTIYVADSGNSRILYFNTAAPPADTTKPMVAFVVTTPVNSLTIPVTTFTATDAGGVAGYLITETATAPLATDSGWSSTAPTSYTASSASIKTLYAWAKDKADNVSAAKTAAVIFDMTKPVVTVFTVPVTTATLAVKVAITATDNVAVTGYQITNSSTAPAADDSHWTSAKPASYTLASNTADGSATLYAWAKDKAGNVSDAKSTTVSLAVPPVVTVFTVPALVASQTISPITITATDNTGVTGYLITTTSTVPLVTATGWTSDAPTSFKVTTDGAKTLYAWAKDAAGKVSLAKKAIATVDTTPPTVKAFTMPSASNSLTVPVTITATDNVAVGAYIIVEGDPAVPAPIPDTPNVDDAGWKITKPTNYIFAGDAADGVKHLWIWVKDTAGNIATIPLLASTKIDRAVPSITAFVAPGNFNNLTVPITTLTTTDNGSGVAGYKFTTTSVAPLATASGWSTTKPITFKVTVVGSNTVYLWIKDGAGNVSASATATVSIDTVKPVVTFTAPATSGLTVTFTTFSATDVVGVTGYLTTLTSAIPSSKDSANGIWSATAPTSYTFAPGTTAGVKKIYGWAKDAAGNISLAKYVSVSVTP